MGMDLNNAYRKAVKCLMRGRISFAELVESGANAVDAFRVIAELVENKLVADAGEGVFETVANEDAIAAYDKEHADEDHAEELAKPSQYDSKTERYNSEIDKIVEELLRDDLPTSEAEEQDGKAEGVEDQTSTSLSAMVNKAKAQIDDAKVKAALLYAKMSTAIVSWGSKVIALVPVFFTDSALKLFFHTCKQSKEAMAFFENFNQYEAFVQEKLEVKASQLTTVVITNDGRKFVWPSVEPLFVFAESKSVDVKEKFMVQFKLNLD